MINIGPENLGFSYEESCSPSTSNALQNVIIVTVITTDIRDIIMIEVVIIIIIKHFLQNLLETELRLGNTDQTAGYDGMSIKTLGCCITAIFPCNHYCNVLQWLITAIRLICSVLNSATRHF